MRVLTVVCDLGPGGTQRAAQNYSLGYRSAGHEVAVLTYRGGGVRARALEEAGLPVFVGSEVDGVEKGLARAIDWRPDLVHIHREGRTEPLAGRVLRDLKAGLGDTLRVLETNVFARVDYSPDRLLIDVHLQLSQWCLWKWQQWAASIRPAPIGAICPYGIETEQFFPVGSAAARTFREVHGIPQDALVFGRIGQPIIWKWSPIIFDAFAAVARRYPDAHLLLVGLPEELRPALEALDADVRQRVTDIAFLHGDEALRSGYAAMDVFLHASQIGESFGMVLAEAICCGCPVVTLSTPTKDNSQLEVVGHEQGGLIAADLSGMIEAMSRLAEDSSLRRRLAAEGRRRIAEHYDLDRVMELLLRIAEETLQAPRAVLRRNLQDAGIITHVEDASIERLLANTLGTMPHRERMLMRLVHQPHVYRIWDWLKHR